VDEVKKNEKYKLCQIFEFTSLDSIFNFITVFYATVYPTGFTDGHHLDFTGNLCES